MHYVSRLRRLVLWIEEPPTLMIMDEVGSGRPKLCSFTHICGEHVALIAVVAFRAVPLLIWAEVLHRDVILDGVVDESFVSWRGFNWFTDHS